jgi:hypothetical protein
MNDQSDGTVASSPARAVVSPERARPAGRHRSRLSIRAGIGITLITVWSAATFTGVLLYVAPTGRRSGRDDILLGLTKTTWGDIHWWVSLAAVAVTIVHVIVDWKTFRACLRHIVHATASNAPSAGLPPRST